MREYSRKSYISNKNYNDFINSSQDFQSTNKKHSEMKKPYLTNNDFQGMETDTDAPPGMPNHNIGRPYPPKTPINKNSPKHSPTSGGGLSNDRPQKTKSQDEHEPIYPSFYDIKFPTGKAKPTDPTRRKCVCPGVDYMVALPFNIGGMKSATSGSNVYMTNNPRAFVVKAGNDIGYKDKVNFSFKDAKTYTQYYGSLEGCAPGECEPVCVCGSETIAYSHNQMSVGSTQTLIVMGAVTGCTYNWAITSGGGSLSASTGTSVVYTAPASNANCTNNPTITMSCGSTLKDTLKIAVNAAPDPTWVAWKYCVGATTTPPAHTPPYAYRITDVESAGYCDGHIVTNPMGYYDAYAWEGLDECYTCNRSHGAPYYCNSYLDARTSAMKTAGCCPAELL